MARESPLSLITLLTDFGQSDTYVGQMHGVIATLSPEVRMIDLTHDVPPQNILAGALQLDAAVDAFPDGTVHVAVVDPGVGTGRKIIAAGAGGRVFVAPDNGLLSRVLRLQAPGQIVEVAEPRFWLDPVSATFHGRDIMTPVAAHLARGVALSKLGPPVDSIAELPWADVSAEGNRIRGEVISIDSFGNVITNVSAGDLTGRGLAQVQVAGETIAQFAHTYGDAPPGSLMVLIGSSGLLEIAEVNGSAAGRLGIGVGEELMVQLTRSSE